MENYPDFEKLAHIIQHGLKGFIVKNIEAESTEANDLGHIDFLHVLAKHRKLVERGK